MSYLHGAGNSEAATSLTTPTTSSAGLQVIFGTAPIHLAKDPYKAANTPKLCYKFEECQEALGYSDDFENFTLCQSMDANFRVYNNSPIVLVNVLDPNKAAHTTENAEETVTVTGGSDGYLHATKISTGNQIGNVIVDTNNTVDVTGTLNQNTKDNDLHLDTPQGEMIIRLDPSTEMGSCAFLVLNGKYRITCGRGSDAYLHAVKIADASSAANTSASVNGDNSAYPFINGTVDSKTTNNLLYLSTTGGTMQFVIDNNANTLKGLMMTSGRSLTVYYYHGNDGYLHAVTTVGARSSSSASVNTASTLTATGTVNGNSTENMLFLDTPQGQMEIKLDSVNAINGCRVLVTNQRISVTCASGSDAYLHAVTITAK